MSDGFRCRDRRPDTGRELEQGLLTGNPLQGPHPLPHFEVWEPVMGCLVACPSESLAGPSTNVGMRAGPQ